MSDRPFLETETVVSKLLGDIGGLKVVDIGAGTGEVTRKLDVLGACVTGVEPNAEALKVAQSDGEEIRYVEAVAEATGLETEEFDVSLFSFSLHHTDDMNTAVQEACRLTRSGGRILVIEPEASDPIYPVMRFIDDESAVYAEAQKALDHATATGPLERIRTLHFASKYRTDSPAGMLHDLIRVDADRRLAENDRAAFEEAFFSAHQRDSSGGYIPYWSRADLFSRH